MVRNSQVGCTDRQRTEGPCAWPVTAGREQICRQVRVGAVLLADKVKPPVGVVAHIGSIRGEQVHGKESSMAAQVGEQ